MPSFQVYKQHDSRDCGPTCLRMIAKHYGKSFSLNSMRQVSDFNREGVSLLGISDAAEKIGFRTIGAKLTYEQLVNEAQQPSILHWDQNHFVVLPPQRFKKGVTVADPARGIIYYSKEDFKEYWLQANDNGTEKGISLLLEPTAKFYEENFYQPNQKEGAARKFGWNTFSYYYLQHKKAILQLILGLLIGSLLQLIFPFLTQSIVDTGINTRNIEYVFVVLIAQLMLSLSSTIVDFIRSRILFFISTHINISIVSDFWLKLMRLPLSFFDTKHVGDLLQRIGDHRRIEEFLTGNTLNILFSIFNFLIFSVVIILYNTTVFYIFVLGSILYFLWIKIFLRYTRALDYKRFAVASRESSATMQLIYGMQEIKLNNAETIRRWEWEGLQASLFKISLKSLSLGQYQQAGAFFLTQAKNILITFFVAKSVIEGQLTLGAMLAIQYILGQLNGPVQQIVGFVQAAQFAKISLERLSEIHELDDEEMPFLSQETFNQSWSMFNKSITIQNLFFSYTGTGNEPVLKNINMIIPEGKITAIVGMSGSGKTTLLKLLLRFYENYKGEIRVGDPMQTSLENATLAEPQNSISLKYISPKSWRSRCGTVLQDGYIFNDSIAKNIAVSEDTPDYHKLLHACKVANIVDFIESLPLGFNTKIGVEGNGISQGQRQRILIARAVYRDPDYIFFDEATNSLDANNEKVIMDNLQQFFKGRTVVIVAHRLSTVKNADNIVVLHGSEIAEQGSHTELSKKRGHYYHLVKNQLDLGN